MIVLIIVLVLVFVWALIIQEIKIRKLVKQVDTHSITIVRLVYHESIRHEDYESTNTIKKKMPKDFDFYKFL